MSVRLNLRSHLARTHTRSCAHNHACGLSLVELLIVIAVLALLAGTLAPMLGTSQSTARMVLCQSRLHQWGTAFAAYAANNGGL